MEARANDAQLACAEPRVAAAAEPHKRRAVAAGTAVGPAVGVGGKQSPEATDVAGNITGDGAAAADCGYRLVVNRRRGARAPKAAKARPRRGHRQSG